MTDNTSRTDEPRVSRLNLVRAGGGDSGSLRIPKRGRVMVDVESLVPDPKNERKVFIRSTRSPLETLGSLDLVRTANDVPPKR
jgi:hypothetical protein